MRLDHIAYRVKDRIKTANFLMSCLGYRIADDLPDGFEITFEDNSKAQCLVLLPPEKPLSIVPWSHLNVTPTNEKAAYHLPPEIFVSNGTPGSIVEEWVNKRDGVGGIHHLAYQVDSVETTMEEWRNKGYAEFTTKEPLRCEGLVQCFTQPSELTGIIYEFIEREQHGFCQANVKDLMLSTKKIT